MKKLLEQKRLYSITLVDYIAKRVSQYLIEDGGILFMYIPMPDGYVEIAVRDDMSSVLEKMIDDLEKMIDGDEMPDLKIG